MLSVEHVTKKYGSFTALEDISLGQCRVEKQAGEGHRQSPAQRHGLSAEMPQQQVHRYAHQHRRPADRRETGRMPWI